MASTDLATLLTARSNLIAAYLESSLNPQPSYSKGNQSVSWAEYRAGLLAEQQAINIQIDQAGGPWEVITQGYG